MGRIVSLADLSEIVGRSQRTLIEWDAEGLPIVERGDAGLASKYDTAAVIGWMIAAATARRDATVEVERRRLIAAQATRAELELAERRGDLVNLQRFREGAARASRELSESLLAIPARIAPTIDSVNPARAQDLIEAEIRRCLSQVAAYLETLAEKSSADVCTGSEGPRA